MLYWHIIKQQISSEVKKAFHYSTTIKVRRMQIAGYIFLMYVMLVLHSVKSFLRSGKSPFGQDMSIRSFRLQMNGLAR